MVWIRFVGSKEQNLLKFKYSKFKKKIIRSSFVKNIEIQKIG